MIPGHTPCMMKRRRSPTVTFLSQGNSSTAGVGKSFSVTVPPNGSKPCLLVIGTHHNTTINNATMTSVVWNGITLPIIATTGVGVANNYQRAALAVVALTAAQRDGVAHTLTTTLSASSVRGDYGAWIIEDYTSTTPLVTPTDARTTTNSVNLDFGVRKIGDVTISFVANYRATTNTWNMTGLDFSADITAATIHYGGGHFTVTSPGSANTFPSITGATFNHGVAVGAAFK